MISSRHDFYAMGSDCAVHLVAERSSDIATFARAAEAEVVQIERRYSRYRADSELRRINAAAANGASVGIDEETGCVYRKPHPS
jgi:FAD:protein FMN transferase